MEEHEKILKKRLKTLDRALVKADEKGQKRRVQAIRREMAALRKAIVCMEAVVIFNQPDNWEG